jgi:hypothetical protein
MVKNIYSDYLLLVAKFATVTNEPDCVKSLQKKFT